jgi:uncharacterized protein (TIGR03083 family)
MMVAEPYRGPWPDTGELVERELAAYLATAADLDNVDLPTRCPPWTIKDMTAHLAATFDRFNRMLAQGRSGDLKRPFARESLSAENLRAVGHFEGDPLQGLEQEALRFVGSATDPLEIMPHQFGPIPVALQMLFGLNELAIHHDDIATAAGRRYRPDTDVLEVLKPVWERALGGLPGTDDVWTDILTASGRIPA